MASNSEFCGYREEILDDPRVKVQPPVQAVGAAVTQPRTAWASGQWKQKMNPQKTHSAGSCRSDMEKPLALLKIRRAKFPLCSFSFCNWHGRAEEGENAVNNAGLEKVSGQAISSREYWLQFKPCQSNLSLNISADGNFAASPFKIFLKAFAFFSLFLCKIKLFKNFLCLS